MAARLPAAIVWGTPAEASRGSPRRAHCGRDNMAEHAHSRAAANLAHPAAVAARAPTEDLPRVRRGVVSGLPVFWAESPGPFVAGLLFRVGRADETATHGGITHLVEHLALPAGRLDRVDFNGGVSSSATWFWAAGDRAAALDLLRTTAESLSALPARLETERGILLTEAEGRGDGAAQLAAALRFGPAGHGLVGYPELGLRWLGPREVSAWARGRFTSGNVALWMTAEPPPDLGLTLPAGERRRVPEPRPLPEVRFPCVFAHGRPGGVAVSMLMERSAAGSMAAGVAAERARELLRYERGLTYTVELSWEPLTGEVASVVLACDCRQGSERAVERLLRGLLEELAEDGPAEAELARELTERERHMADPSGVGGLLFSAASDELLLREQLQPGELLAEAAAVTPSTAAAALDAGLRSGLLVTADERWRPDGGWSEYPLHSAEVLPGRSFRSPGASRKPAARMQAGADGVSYVSPGADPLTVRFADCVALERWPDGFRVVIGRDAARLVVDPSAWQGGDRLVAWIDEHVPADRVVPMNEPVERRAAELRAELGGDLARELESATAHLELGEVPLDALGGTLGDEAGVLVVTARRLVFTAGGRLLVAVPLHALTSVQQRGGRWPAGRTLVVRTEKETLAFRDTAPNPRIDVFVEALRGACEHDGSPLVVDEPPSRRASLAAHASLLAFPLSWLVLYPLSLLEDPESHARTVTLSVVVALLCGGTCAAGIRLGLAGRRYAADGGERSAAAVAGVALGVVGVLIWLTLAISVPVSEW
jgi:hypothetical protein